MRQSPYQYTTPLHSFRLLIALCQRSSSPPVQGRGCSCSVGLSALWDGRQEAYSWPTIEVVQSLWPPMYRCAVTSDDRRAQDPSERMSTRPISSAAPTASLKEKAAAPTPASTCCEVVAPTSGAPGSHAHTHTASSVTAVGSITDDSQRGADLVRPTILRDCRHAFA
jgi:hypothetical protein